MRKSVGLVAAGVALAGMGVAAGWAAGAAGRPSTAATGLQTTTLGSDVVTNTGILAGKLVSFDSCSALLDALHARARDVRAPLRAFRSREPLRRPEVRRGFDRREPGSEGGGSPVVSRRADLGRRWGLRRTWAR